MNDLFPHHKIIKGEDYYALTLLGDSEGRTWTSGQTCWAGFADEDSRIEIRTLSLVKADVMAENWEYLHQPFLVVNTDKDYYRWFLCGGHALITQSMIESHIPWELEPRECVQERFLEGFTPLSQLPKGAFNRAPTPKLRMKVLKRDGYKCKICGRRPADYVDVELHVHHIRPYGKRGVTTEKNLVALCQTCHNGLDPHFELSLYSLIDPKPAESGDDLKRRLLEKYVEGVRLHRKAMREKLEAYKTKNSEQDGAD